MKNPQYEIPQWALDAAIGGLQELARRLEDDAVAFAKLDTPEGCIKAQERMKKAREAWRGHEFYIHL